MVLTFQFKLNLIKTKTREKVVFVSIIPLIQQYLRIII